MPVQIYDTGFIQASVSGNNFKEFLPPPNIVDLQVITARDNLSLTGEYGYFKLISHLKSKNLHHLFHLYYYLCPVI